MKNLVTFLILLTTQFSISQTISTDAPSVSAGATTVGGGIFQVESRLQYGQIEGTQILQLPSNLFRLGIGDKFELRMTNGITRREKLIDLDRMSLGFKAQLLNKPEGNTQIAFLFNAVLPDFKSNFYSGGGTFAVNHVIGDKSNIGYNVGYNYTSIGPAGSTIEYHSIFGSLIYSYALTDKLSLFSELYGGYINLTTMGIETTSISFDCGFLYLVTDKFKIDYSYGLGLSDEHSFHAIGFNFMIGRKEK
jgi:hypothetical protein